MQVYLFEMTTAQIDAAAERYYDRLFDLYYGADEEDPWERDDPDWKEVADIVDGQHWKTICGLMRDYIEGDGDLMVEIEKAGLLDSYIHPEERGLLKDPDDEWNLCEAVFDREWENDELFKAIYLWLPENHVHKLCEGLKEKADRNDEHWVRKAYNRMNGGC